MLGISLAENDLLSSYRTLVKKFGLHALLEL
jgi:hypothetical protein